MENNGFKAICIGAGGTVGLYYMGVLDYYYEKKLLNDVMYYSGTSIGALICGFLMIGYSPRDMLVYSCKKDFTKHIGKMSIQNLLTKYGLIDTTELKKYLETAIIDKLGFIPTLKDMYDSVKKIFYCTGYKVSRDAKESSANTYFSYETHPTMLLSDAMMCSCSIPFLFSRSPVDDGVYIDGAVFDPVPVKILMDHFLQEDYKQILTISFKRKNQKEDENIFTYAGQVISVILQKDEILTLASMTEHVLVETENSPFNFEMDNVKKINMFLDGQQIVKKKYVKKEKID